MLGAGNGRLEKGSRRVEPSDHEQGEERARARRPVRSLFQVFSSPDSYGLLLLLIALTYVLSVSLTGAWSASVVLAIQMLTLWVALHTSRARRPLRLFCLVVIVLAGAAAIGNLAAQADRVPAFAFLASLLLYFVAPFVIVRNIALRREVDTQTLLGAVCAYLMIGMFFAFAYRFIGIVQGGAFFGPQGEGTVPQDLFFSFTTLTTTGYGNLVPAANPGQSLAVLEMVVGQLFLITAVGKIISAWTPRRLKAEQSDG
jgi:hypothetical protein